MPLKFKIETLEEAEEFLRPHYKEVKLGDNTTYVLQIDGAVPIERLTEIQNKLQTFRKTNARLAERLKVFVEHAGIEPDEDATPEDLADLLKEKREELESSLKGKGKASKEEIEAELTQRVETFKAKHETSLQKLKEEKEAIERELKAKQDEIAELAIGQEVREVGGKFGLLPKASKVIVNAALKTFRRMDGKTRCVDAEGDPIRGSDGVSEQTISDWIENVAAKEYDFAFQSNAGGGASGSGGAGKNGGTGPNPWKRETWDLTRQMTLIKRDPATARRLAQEAGAKVPAVTTG